MRKVFTVFLIVFFCVGIVYAQANLGDDMGRNMGEVRENISELKDVITSNYEVLLSENSEASGEITIKFSISPDGTILDPVVECSEEVRVLHDPVLEALRNLEFRPESEQQEDIPVTVPISLLPPR